MEAGIVEEPTSPTVDDLMAFGRLKASNHPKAIQVFNEFTLTKDRDSFNLALLELVKSDHSQPRIQNDRGKTGNKSHTVPPDLENVQKILVPEATHHNNFDLPLSSSESASFTRWDDFDLPSQSPSPDDGTTLLALSMQDSLGFDEKSNGMVATSEIVESLIRSPARRQDNLNVQDVSYHYHPLTFQAQNPSSIPSIPSPPSISWGPNSPPWPHPGFSYPSIPPMPMYHQHHHFQMAMAAHAMQMSMYVVPGMYPTPFMNGHPPFMMNGHAHFMQMDGGPPPMPSINPMAPQWSHSLMMDGTVHQQLSFTADETDSTTGGSQFKGVEANAEEQLDKAENEGSTNRKKSRSQKNKEVKPEVVKSNPRSEKEVKVSSPTASPTISAPASTTSDSTATAASPAAVAAVVAAAAAAPVHESESSTNRKKSRSQKNKEVKPEEVKTNKR